MRGCRKLIAVVFAAACLGAEAFVIEKAAPGPQMRMEGRTPVVDIGEWSFSIVEVPTAAPQLERVKTLEKHRQFEGRLNLGDEAVTEAEALQVLEAYFRATAFDYDSVRLRNLVVGEQWFVVWCGEWLLLCLEGRGAGGTWVEYEANGRNRSGGMTGFRKTVVMLRKYRSQPPS